MDALKEGISAPAALGVAPWRTYRRSPPGSGGTSRPRASGAIYMDLCSVFGTVAHGVLVSVLERCGFDG